MGAEAGKAAPSRHQQKVTKEDFAEKLERQVSKPSDARQKHVRIQKLFDQNKGQTIPTKLKTLPLDCFGIGYSCVLVKITQFDVTYDPVDRNGYENGGSASLA